MGASFPQAPELPAVNHALREGIWEVLLGNKSA